MKKFSVLFLLLICSSLLAQGKKFVYEKNPEVRQAVTDYYNNDKPKLISRVETMIQNNYFRISHIDDSNVIVHMGYLYWDRITSKNDEHKKIMLKIIAYYISQKRNPEFPLRVINYNDDQNNVVAQYSTLSEEVYYTSTYM